MVKIYGAVGYTILNHTKLNKYIIVFADIHTKLSDCCASSLEKYTICNQINIADWLKQKFNTSHILLEEITRGNFQLEELWPLSNHIQDLKKLFLDNSNKIKPIDIRPFFIPFSWEVLNTLDKNTMLLKNYLKEIDNFFSIQNKYLIKILDYYNYEKIKDINIGKHFLYIKKIL